MRFLNSDCVFSMQAHVVLLTNLPHVIINIFFRFSQFTFTTHKPKYI